MLSLHTMSRDAHLAILKRRAFITGRENLCGKIKHNNAMHVQANSVSHSNKKEKIVR